MEPTPQDQPAPEDVVLLLRERDGLNRRLAGIDQRLEALYALRQDDLSRRLASIEEGMRALQRQGAAPPAPVPSQPTTPGVPTALHPTPATTDSPVPVGGPPSDAQPAPQPAAFTLAAPVTPRIVGERIAVDAVTLWSGPHGDAVNRGWVTPGTRLLLTEVTEGHRVLVAYQNQLSWVDPTWLATAPASGAPVAQAPVGPALSVQPAAASQPAERSIQPPAPLPVFAQPSPPTPRPWEHPGFMSKVLALVGAGVTLIGVGFLLVLAAQYGFFGPEARTASAAALGVALVVLAFVVRGRDEANVGAPILAATGVAAGFLSIVTATAVYHWLPPLLGAGLTAAIGLGGMWLARSWKNQWVALISVLGSLGLAAWVGSAEPVATVGLMVLMTAVTLWFERGTSWRLFPFARVLPTVFLLVQIIAVPPRLSSTDVCWVAGMAVAVALLGLLSAVIAPENPPAGQAIALGLLVPMVVPAAMIPLVLTDPVSAAIPLGIVAITFGVVGFVPAVSSRVRWAFVPVGALFILLAVFTITEQRYIGVMTPALGAVYLAVAARTRSSVNFIVGGGLAAVGVVAWLPQTATLVSQQAAEAAGPEQILQSLAGIAAAVLATLATKRWVGSMQPWMLYLSWTLAIVMGSVAVIIAGAWAGAHLGNPAAGYQTGQAVVTSAWMVLCVVFLRRGLAATQNEDAWLHLALAISTFAVGKLFLLDLGMLNAIARVGSFLVVGLLLLFVGTRYARAWERAHGDTESEPQPLGTTQEYPPPAPDTRAPDPAGVPAAPAPADTEE